MNLLTNSDFCKLQYAIAVYPCSFQVSGNDSNEKPIDLKVASTQYNHLINTLMDYGVKLYFLDLNGSNSQLFTRDIGFVIGDLLFVAKMKQPERQAEIQGLIEFAQKNNIKHHIMRNTVEGGDILIHDKKVFIGQGDRTSEAAVDEIGKVLAEHNAQWELIKGYFDTTKIHLDCVFNILDANTCILSKDTYNRQDLSKHFSRVLEPTDEELKSLAPNIITIDHKDILCSSKSFTEVLKRNGYNAIYIDFSEIIKDGGSLGCCMLPLIRAEN